MTPMLQKLRTLFSLETVSAEDQAQRVRLAAAALLIELSKADYRRDVREQQAIVAAVRRCHGLDDATIAELVHAAAGASDRSTSLYEFTSVINERCSEDEKYRLVVELWRVANADGDIDKYEDHLIGKIADLIYLPRSLFVKAKLEVLGE
jgi:uncharacterized tellurite resistance protein B-like protein